MKAKTLKNKIAKLILVGFVFLTGCTQPILSGPTTPIPTLPGWNLIWHDEFDGDSIDLNNWTYDIGGWGWGNGELEFYTDRPMNARLENGMLVIEAHQEKYEDSYYTSARLKTEGLQTFQYGRIEGRLKVPEAPVCGRHSGCLALISMVITGLTVEKLISWNTLGKSPI